MKVFKEEQRFTQSWLIIILIVAIGVPFLFGVYGIIQQVIYKIPLGQKPMSDVGLIIFTVSMFLLTLLIFFMKLSTRIDQEGIQYQFYPFHFSMKKISWDKIEKVGVRTYLPISEFGGWGLRGGFFFNKGKEEAVNISGNIGIQLILKSGKKLLIGTQKENEAKSVLETYKSKIN
ncbi:hypothetical protein K8354_05050 [Polaribacter litorisediminis]|uniref:hypothetical protein n=1 Tax=Polaribacter litorisediminis TaxID=1908341 RepID=UPI001CBC117F|nr:hypothetical protein [Polaribacter litorisediminis]UAM99192.1 hypothetical protein K8354_05050 [Polaribacter litorisediminis]